MDNYIIYTDASFCHKRRVCVSGFFIFNNFEEHQSGFISTSLVRTVKFEERNNIRGELRGVIYALEALEKTLQKKISAKSQKDLAITLYTDCQAVLKLLFRREKLESTHYRSNRKKTVLPNADIYKIFFSIYDRLQPKIIWVKGHSPSKDQNIVEKNFSFIDKAVRKELRG